jgi:hypothetical protein
VNWKVSPTTGGPVAELRGEVERDLVGRPVRARDLGDLRLGLLVAVVDDDGLLLLRARDVGDGGSVLRDLLLHRLLVGEKRLVLRILLVERVLEQAQRRVAAARHQREHQDDQADEREADVRVLVRDGGELGSTLSILSSLATEVLLFRSPAMPAVHDGSGRGDQSDEAKPSDEVHQEPQPEHEQRERGDDRDVDPEPRASLLRFCVHSFLLESLGS